MTVKQYDKKFLEKLYSTMLRIRLFEEQVLEFYKYGKMPGLAHLYIGEEAVATGACAALKPGDFAGSTHRGHGHVIAQGADTKRMMAEILGKKDGYCQGKGGSMHIMDMSKGILGANGIVGAGIPIATGAAYMAKVKKTNQVVLSFFGDAASNQGTFHESINMATAWKLPIVYIIENNLYGISVALNRVVNVEDLSVRAKGYGINGVTIDGNDVLQVYETVKQAVDFARAGNGPTLIECKTYRWKGHHAGDPATGYRTKEEEAAWKEKCPIKKFREYLLSTRIAEKEIAKLEAGIAAEIKAATEFAENSPYPDAAEAFTNIYAE
jgi:pyruvate dehydrogenase E1 component alpha subunit